jgi:hypothetical protein
MFFIVESVLRIIRKRMAAGLAFVAILSAFQFASASRLRAELHYELENPFRFFKYVSDYAIHRIAFDLSMIEKNTSDRSKIAVDDVQDRLSERSFWERPIKAEERKQLHWPASWSGNTPFQIIEALRESENRAKINELTELSKVGQSISSLETLVRFGWATLLETHSSWATTAVCWNRLDRLHNNCPDYKRPKTWRVRIFDDVNVEGACSWAVGQGGILVAGRSPAANQSCNEVLIEIQAEGAHYQTPSGKVTVRRTSASGSISIIDVTVRDFLIVGLGDSYTSGEGNPDRPAIFDSNLTLDRGRPQRPDESRVDDDAWAAQWIDRSCHRSAYGWPLRAALHRALISPQSAVTFIGLGCSGAEIFEGLFYVYQGPEPTPSARIKSRPQLRAIYDELCDLPENTSNDAIPDEELDSFLSRLSDPRMYPWAANEQTAAQKISTTLRCKIGGKFVRPIDALMIGIGGNDLGFSLWVAAAVLPEGFFLRRSGGFIPRVDRCQPNELACNLTNARLARLDSRYAILGKVLRQRLFKDAMLTADKVAVTGYPKALTGVDSEPCPKGNGGMTIATYAKFDPYADPIMAVQSTNHLRTIEHFRSDYLMPRIEKFAGASKDKFHFVVGHVDRFKTHGFCATENPDEKNGRLDDRATIRSLRPLGGKIARDTLHLPIRGETYRDARGRKFEDPWTPFAPSAWYPYASRSRWLRTPNDVYMTVNNKSWMTREDTVFGILDMTKRPRSGAFHPTAQGHAATATAVMPALDAALK